MITTITTAVTTAVKDAFGLTVQPDITRPDAEFGDFATNVAMQIAFQLKKKPRDIADIIVRELLREDTVVSATVAGPGFINIRLHDTELVTAITAPSRCVENRGQVVVIETNNPNPFKVLHIGHAYNCIIADTVANILEYGGATVHRVSYHGDVGLHVGKSMWAIFQWCGGDIGRLDTVAAAERLGFMSERYVEGSTAYDHDLDAKTEIERLSKQSFVLDDPQYKKVYEQTKQWSFDYITTVIAQLGSKPVERRYLESETDAVGVATVKEHIGDVFSESEGAVVFAGEAFGLHTRVFINGRGTGLYEAHDMGLMQLKQADYHPAKSYIVTGNEQREYFKVVIKAAELALPELDGVTVNISTGIVKLSSGKMSSRTGNVLNIEWLFWQMRAALVARGGSETDTMTMVGALRYAMLKVRIGSDVVFDIESSISLDGNSGPYLQYAHARAASILAKSTKAPAIDIEQLDKTERLLALKISEYDEILSLTIRERLPHHICTYLYELAQTFNRFYEKSRIIDDPRESVRLVLVGAYADRLSSGLRVLGIEAPERL